MNTRNTKLTLRLDKDLIDSAKKYSALTGKSISRLVADLFTVIRNERLQQDVKLTATVKSLKGVLKGKQVSEDDYKRYLEGKYL